MSSYRRQLFGMLAQRIWMYASQTFVFIDYDKLMLRMPHFAVFLSSSEYFLMYWHIWAVASFSVKRQNSIIKRTTKRTYLSGRTSRRVLANPAQIHYLRICRLFSKEYFKQIPHRISIRKLFLATEHLTSFVRITIWIVCFGEHSLWDRGKFLVGRVVEEATWNA